MDVSFYFVYVDCAHQRSVHEHSKFYIVVSKATLDTEDGRIHRVL